MEHDLYRDIVPVPRAARFPVELRPPAGFRADDPATWPKVQGRLEYVGGRLLYMPPCGGVQGGVAIPLFTVLGSWQEGHPEFFVGGNEQGMLLGGEVRGAEAAVWLRASLGEIPRGYVRVPPVLAAEVLGQDEEEADLREKANWYLGNGVKVVWILLPDSREVLVVTATGVQTFALGDRLPAAPDLPDLSPEVATFFRQL
jgi:Uma2 family endonuclease